MNCPVSDDYNDAEFFRWVVVEVELTALRLVLYSEIIVQMTGLSRTPVIIRFSTTTPRIASSIVSYIVYYTSLIYPSQPENL